MTHPDALPPKEQDAPLMEQGDKEKLPQKIEPSSLEDRISELSAETPAETMYWLRQKIDIYKRAIRELDKQYREKLFEWLDQNNTQLEVGNTRYFVGTETDRQARDTKAALIGLFEASGGDIETVADCISGGKSAWKYARCKEVLGERFDQFFSEDQKKDTKTGRPLKEVKEANEFTQSRR